MSKEEYLSKGTFVEKKSDKRRFQSPSLKVTAKALKAIGLGRPAFPFGIRCIFRGDVCSW